MNLAIVAFDRVDELDVVGPLEVLRRAAQLDHQFRVELVTLGPSLEIAGHYGLRMIADGILHDDTDVLIVPGGGWASRSPQGVRAELDRGTLPKRIAELYERGCFIASVCTGALLVAASGVANGRRMTTHASALGDLERFGVVAVRDRVVDDGRIVSGAGVTSGIDLGLYVVERFAGAELANTIATTIEYQRTQIAPSS